MKKPTQHGGPREGSGRPRISKSGKRATVSVCLSPENAALRESLGREWNNFVNMLLDQYRGRKEKE